MNIKGHLFENEKVFIENEMSVIENGRKRIEDKRHSIEHRRFLYGFDSVFIRFRLNFTGSVSRHLQLFGI